MVEKEIKEKKEALKVKAGEVKDTAAEHKEALKVKVGEVKETAAEKKDDARELAASGRSQADNILNNIFNSFRSTQEDVSKAISDYTMSMEKPLADVIETDDKIIVKTDLPGVDKEDVDVRLTEDSVEITAAFEEEYDEEDINYIRKERNYGESQRFIQLPTKIKVKDAVAKFENSVLTITLPKVDGEKFKVSIK
jgi:HSP20 family protein